MAQAGRLWATFLAAGAMALPAASQEKTHPDNWRSVEALSPQTSVDVRTDHGRATCRVLAVTDDQLTCSKGTFSVAEIHSVAVAHPLRSEITWLGVGAGTGAVLGAGAGIASKGAFWENSNGKAAGAGAAVFGILGAGVGALVGHSGHFFERKLYHR